jgi:hypothetical protein
MSCVKNDLSRVCRKTSQPAGAAPPPRCPSSWRLVSCITACLTSCCREAIRLHARDVPPAADYWGHGGMRPAWCADLAMTFRATKSGHDRGGRGGRGCVEITVRQADLGQPSPVETTALAQGPPPSNHRGCNDLNGLGSAGQPLSVPGPASPEDHQRTNSAFTADDRPSTDGQPVESIDHRCSEAHRSASAGSNTTTTATPGPGRTPSRSCTGTNPARSGPARNWF